MGLTDLTEQDFINLIVNNTCQNTKLEPLIQLFGKRYAECVAKKEEFFKKENQKYKNELNTKIKTLEKLGNIPKD
ncbi:MAG: hypothetical protein EA365_02885 [Gloeocapsa sp. DLM2.Bin57]|nr:MAG: hypothetical protein EA365_02885 [Gloeocapsa sp. DLM2.Bin57]